VRIAPPAPEAEIMKLANVSDLESGD
jgi:hypothetical protein